MTATKVENKAATLSDLDLNAAKKTGSTLVVNGATYDVSADGKTITETASGNNKVMYLSKSEGGSPILVNEDAAKSLQSTTNPLETIDKALLKLTICVLTSVQYKTVSTLPSPTLATP